MRTFLKLTSACLILGVALQGTAFAQSSGARTFGAESVEYAQEAQAAQAANDHKRAIKRLKKGLKVDGLSPYETSTMYQMLSASYYATQKNDKSIEAMQNAIDAGGLTRKDKTDLQVNMAQLNVVEENFALGAQQLETYFREGGVQKSTLVKMLVRAHVRSENRAAAVPWAEVMLRQGYLDTRREHDVAVYLFDSPEKRASQMQVGRQIYAKWPTDPAAITQIKRLNAKAKREGVPTIFIAGQ